MVKKKAPFIPITIIVIGAGLIFAFNSRSRPVDPQEEMRRQQEQLAANQPDHPAVDADKVHDAMKGGMGATPQTDDHKPQLKSGGPGSTGDYMLAPKERVYKPQPTDTSVASQWYKPK